MATMINNNVGSFGSQPMFGQSKAAFQRGIGQRTAMTGLAGDALGSMSILNQNRIAAQREAQRASKTTQTDDDAINNVSAYTIEESLRIRTQVLDQANKNIQDDTALLKTAQGSGNSIVDSIKEIQRLATTATDEALTDVDRRVIQRDINRLVNQISTDSQITFNGRKLIDGSATTSNPSTATILSNNALYSGTTASTALTALQNSNGGSLGIEATDRITASYVQGGNIYTTSFTVGNNKLEDIFINLNKINGVSLRDSAFVGGASNILTKPVEPPAPIAPTEPEEVPQPVIPREFVPDSAPALESFETADEYHAAEAIYGAVQAGTATIIEEDVENYASKSFEERTAEITAYNQYLNEMDIYNSAQANYEAAYAKYAAYLEKNPDAAEADSSTIADYNRYVNQKDSYDSARAAFNTQLMQSLQITLRMLPTTARLMKIMRLISTRLPIRLTWNAKGLSMLTTNICKTVIIRLRKIIKRLMKNIRLTLRLIPVWLSSMKGNQANTKGFIRNMRLTRMITKKISCRNIKKTWQIIMLWQPTLSNPTAATA